MISIIDYLFEQQTPVPPKTIPQKLIDALKEVISSIKTGKELTDMIINKPKK